MLSGAVKPITSWQRFSWDMLQSVVASSGAILVRLHGDYRSRRKSCSWPTFVFNVQYSNSSSLIQIRPLSPQGGRGRIKQVTGLSRSTKEMPHSVHPTPRATTPDLSARYWNVNQPKEQWTEECPEYLSGQSEKNINTLIRKDEDFERFSWDKVQDLVSRCRHAPLGMTVFEKGRG